jgi:hypothetical protein
MKPDERHERHEYDERHEHDDDRQDEQDCQDGTRTAPGRKATAVYAAQ